MGKNSASRTEDRRREILEAAHKVFAAKGFSEATMDEIAAEAKVAKGSVYNYFRGKQDVFTQLFAAAIAEDEAQTEKITGEPGLTAVQKIGAMLDLWFQRFSAYQHIGRLVLEFWVTVAGEGEGGPFSEMMTGVSKRYRDRLAAVLAEGHAKGEFALQYGPQTAAALIIALMDGIGLHTILGIGRSLDEEYLAAVKRSIYAALAWREQDARSPAQDRKNV